MEFVCLFCPAFLSLLLLDYRKNIFKNTNAFKIISTYFAYNLAINTIILLITKVVFKTYLYIFTVSFTIKYIFIAVILALILPVFIEKIKIEAVISKFKEILQTIIDVCVKHPRICLMLLLTIMFFLIDYFCRIKCYEIAEFYAVNAISTNIISLSYSLLLSAIIVNLPRLLSIITLWVTFLTSLLLFLVNYFLLDIKQEAFSIYELTNAAEGAKFINFVFKSINLNLLKSLILIILVFSICFLVLKKVNYNRTHKLKTIIVAIILFLGVRAIGVKLLGTYNIDDWDAISKPKYYYYNLDNQKRSLNVLGLYEYARRDIYLFIKNNTSKKSDVKKITQVINKRGLKKENNEYSNMFKDKNLIMIMMESIDNVIVDKETMPTLSKMQRDGLNFTNRYAQGISTIATEYTSLTGLYFLDRDYNTYKNDYAISIPSIFTNNGYKTTFIHENKGIYYNRSVLTKAIGFEESYFLYDWLKKPDYFNDIQLASNSKVYNKLINNKEGKFMTFITTIAAHGPYDNNGICNQDETAKLSENNCFRYLAKNTDDFLAKLVERLKEDNLLDDTVIVLFSDHYAYSYDYTKEELKNTYKRITKNYSIKNIPFVIYSSTMKGKKIENILMNDVDILPTLLNMFGIDYDPNLYVGTDVFSSNHKNLILYNDYSWYDGKYYSFNDDVIVNADYKEKNKYVKEIIDFNNMIVNTNYYSRYKQKQE